MPSQERSVVLRMVVGVVLWCSDVVVLWSVLCAKCGVGSAGGLVGCGVGGRECGVVARRHIVTCRVVHLASAVGAHRPSTYRPLVGRRVAPAVAVLRRRRRSASCPPSSGVVVRLAVRLLVMGLPLPPAVGAFVLSARRRRHDIRVRVAVIAPPRCGRSSQRKDPASGVELQDVARSTSVLEEALLLRRGPLVHQRCHGPADERHDRLRGGV